MNRSLPKMRRSLIFPYLPFFCSSHSYFNASLIWWIVLYHQRSWVYQASLIDICWLTHLSYLLRCVSLFPYTTSRRYDKIINYSVSGSLASIRLSISQVGFTCWISHSYSTSIAVDYPGRHLRMWMSVKVSNIYCFSKLEMSRWPVDSLHKGQ